MAPVPDNEHAERRDWFRVEESVGLASCRVAADDRQPAAAHFAATPGLALAQQYQELDREGRYLLDRLAAAHRDLAAVARWLDRKLDLLAQAVTAGQDDAGLPSVPVSLSVVGMDCPLQGLVGPLAAGERLALAIELRPDPVLLTCHARVVQVRDAHAVLQFTDLADDQQQRLTRHLLRAQGRTRRAGSDH